MSIYIAIFINLVTCNLVNLIFILLNRSTHLAYISSEFFICLNFTAERYCYLIDDKIFTYNTLPTTCSPQPELKFNIHHFVY